MVLSCSLGNSAIKSRRQRVKLMNKLQESEALEERYDVKKGDFEKFKARVALGSSEIIFLVEAKDGMRNTWILACSSDLVDGDMGVVQYWIGSKEGGLPENIIPLTGCLLRLSEGQVKEYGISTNLRQKSPDIEAYTEILSRLQII